MSKTASKIITSNRKAAFDYHILDKYEAGIELKGIEAKAIRMGRCNISQAHVGFERGRPVAYNMHIDQIQHSFEKIDPTRTRRLLLNKREIEKLAGRLQESGTALIPLGVHASDSGYIKLSIGVCTGKKLYDKRQAIKEREQKKIVLETKYHKR